MNEINTGEKPSDKQLSNPEKGKKILAELQVIAKRWIDYEYKNYDGTNGWQFLAKEVADFITEHMKPYVDRLLDVSEKMKKRGEEPYVTGAQIAGFWGWIDGHLEEFKENLEPNMWIEVSKRKE